LDWFANTFGLVRIRSLLFGITTKSIYSFTSWGHYSPKNRILLVFSSSHKKHHHSLKSNFSPKNHNLLVFSSSLNKTKSITEIFFPFLFSSSQQHHFPSLKFRIWTLKFFSFFSYQRNNTKILYLNTNMCL
jgi:hypothetical protein